MARYTGPKTKIARRFGEAIFGPDKVLSKKNYPPGQHGNNRRRKTSEYGVMLAEKQKAKYTYGVLERQFRNMFEKAAKMNGITGELLLQGLESRLDNVVYRLGIAPTRAAARQLVGHKHITVDGKVVNIPSYSVKPGQLIGVRERCKLKSLIADPDSGQVRDHLLLRGFMDGYRWQGDEDDYEVVHGRGRARNGCLLSGDP